MSRTLLAAAALAVALSASPAAAQCEGRLDCRMKGLPGRCRARKAGPGSWRLAAVMAGSSGEISATIPRRIAKIVAISGKMNAIFADCGHVLPV